MSFSGRQGGTSQEADMSERCEHLLEVLTADVRLFEKLHDRNNAVEEEEEDKLGLVGSRKDLVDELIGRWRKSTMITLGSIKDLEQRYQEKKQEVDKVRNKSTDRSQVFDAVRRNNNILRKYLARLEDKISTLSDAPHLRAFVSQTLEHTTNQDESRSSDIRRDNFAEAQKPASSTEARIPSPKRTELKEQKGTTASRITFLLELLAEPDSNNLPPPPSAPHLPWKTY